MNRNSKVVLEFLNDNFQKHENYGYVRYKIPQRNELNPFRTPGQQFSQKTETQHQRKSISGIYKPRQANVLFGESVKFCADIFLVVIAVIQFQIRTRFSYRRKFLVQNEELYLHF